VRRRCVPRVPEEHRANQPVCIGSVILDLMDITAILREIDTEIEKLKRARVALSELVGPAPLKKKRRRKPVAAEPLISPSSVITPPRLTIVPPKKKPTYRRTFISVSQGPRALVSAVPNRPVFVPKAAVPPLGVQVKRVAEFDPEVLEAAMRQNLLGRA